MGRELRPLLLLHLHHRFPLHAELVQGIVCHMLLVLLAQKGSCLLLLLLLLEMLLLLLLLLLVSLEGGQFVVLVQRGRSAEHYLAMMPLPLALLIHLLQLDVRRLVILLGGGQVVGRRGSRLAQAQLKIRILQTNMAAVAQGR